MTKEIREVRYTICPVGNASYIAERNGWLREGLAEIGATARLLQTLPKDKWMVHYNYEDTALFREGGNIPPIWSKSNGKEPVLIGLTFLSQKQYIIVRAENLIESVEQLRGRKIGIQSRPEFPIDFYRATAQRGIETALAARGLTLGDINLVDLPVSEKFIGEQANRRSQLGVREVEALDRGEVDAVFSGGTRAQALLESGLYKAIYEITADPDLVWPINNVYPNILTVSRPLAEEAPEVVVAYIKQLLRAADWAKDYRADVETIFAEQTHGTPAQASAARPTDFHRSLAPELTEHGLLALESQKRFLFDHGYIQNDFPIEKWADDRFLKAALKQTGKTLSPAV